MRILFIHQNMPGQFVNLIQRLARDGTHQIACIGRRSDFAPSGVGRVVYTLPPPVIEMNLFLSPLEMATRHGVQVLRACEALIRNGYRPDLIVAHPGWGESLYLKDIYPDVPVLLYCEYFYHAFGADVNFDPAERQDLMANAVTRTRNAHLLLALESADWGYSPTAWQRAQHPVAFQPRISVAFDGIDTDAARPDREASLTLPNGETLRPGDEVVTYVARGLEPYRGFPTFMHALPEILRRRPNARIVIVGGDGTFYGKPPPGDGKSWREVLQAELSLAKESPANGSSHWGRVHFLGRIGRDDYLRLLQVSAAHVYLTVPFVLSWSMLEAMSAGCLVIGSATPPVQEVIEDGRNGLLVDFFSSEALADRVTEALAHPDAFKEIRQAARWTALSSYGLDLCLPRQMRLLEAVAAGKTPEL